MRPGKGEFSGGFEHRVQGFMFRGPPGTFFFLEFRVCGGFFFRGPPSGFEFKF